MPVQKDFKRLVRSRMRKTGEAYTTARLQLLKKHEPAPDYASLAGWSEAAISKNTGRAWADWVRLLDRERAVDKPHREIAAFVSSLGLPGWWSQTVTVGYERIKGLRDKGQRRGGWYEASKSRTFKVPITQLFNAFANSRMRRRWLGTSFAVRSSAPLKRMCLICDDSTTVEVGFWSKGAPKSAVAVQHQRLPDRAAVEAVKHAWAERFDRLGELLS